MQQDFLVYLDKREEASLRRKKNIRNFHAMSVRKKNQTGESKSEERNSDSDQIHRNGYLDENRVLEIVEILQSDASFETKNKHFTLVSENIEWMHGVSIGVIISLQEVLTDLFFSYKAMRECILFVLSEIFIQHGALSINYYKFCDFEIWPFSNEAIKLLSFLSWYDDINSILVQKGVLDYLFNFLEFDSDFFEVFPVVSNIASGEYLIKKSLLNHEILSIVILNTNSQDLRVRESASIVISNLSLEMSSELLEILLKKLSLFKVIEALSMPGDVVVLNYLQLIETIKNELDIEYVDSLFYEKFYYSKNKEISELARHLLSINN